MSAKDTIFALSSGPPPAGVAVVRISGPRVRSGLEMLAGSVPTARKGELRLIKGLDGGVLDRGLVLFFPGPASFTGEDVGEFHLHGGRAVIGGLLDELARIDGFRPADPGEFSRRAFINRKLDLTQVEGFADLISADTEAQRRQAVRQAEGGLYDLYDGWRTRLVKARALIEAGLDFPEEEDVPAAIDLSAWQDLKGLAQEIGAHLDDSRRGERLRDGAEIVVLGPPNVGKSSLINALARRDVAIVTAEPGTTRDLIEVHLDLDGFPATVIDTAGLRESAGLVEAEGIRRAEARAGTADLVLCLSDAGGEVFTAPTNITAPVLTVGTKSDLGVPAINPGQSTTAHDLVISSATGDGMEDLCRRIALFLNSEFAPSESPLITRSRYRDALDTCRSAIIAACVASLADEVRAEELRRATNALGRITGLVDVEDLLDVIFSEFCIGK